MKNILSIFSLIFLLVSCGSDEDNVQRIDQVLKIYIQNQQGQNLLNKDLEGGFSSVQMFDLGGEFTSQVLKGYSVKKDSLDQQYIEYAAGGTRNLVGEIASGQIYQSDLAIAYFITGQTEPVAADELTLQYIHSPILFQIQQINQNGVTIFTKKDGEPNIVYIVK